jgi:hypothetical protein
LYKSQEPRSVVVCWEILGLEAFFRKGEVGDKNVEREEVEVVAFEGGFWR